MLKKAGYTLTKVFVLVFVLLKKKINHISIIKEFKHQLRKMKQFVLENPKYGEVVR